MASGNFIIHNVKFDCPELRIFLFLPEMGIPRDPIKSGSGNTGYSPDWIRAVSQVT